MDFLNLDGKWSLTSAGIGRKLDVELPGDNYTALLNAGIIPDPYYGKNEELVQEYRKMTWEFSRDFKVTAEFLKHEHVFLNMERFDTFCSVFINGKKVIRTGNMFARFRPEVKKFLKAGKNTILFRMDPVEAEGAKREKANGKSYPMCGCSLVPYLNLMRKVHCHGGWDWGVTLCVCGVYDPVNLFAVNTTRIESLYDVQEHGKNSCKVTAIANVYAYCGTKENVTFRFNGEEKVVAARLKEGNNVVKAVFEVKNPKLWWPNGYGEANLYELSAATADMGKTVKLGLRKMEIVNQPDQYGVSMTVRVNGVDVFCKGADWIPCDGFPSRQTPENYRDLLDSTKYANMNMLRVWGGGQYESDCFYEMCDERGIMIWQDMMMACSIYPGTRSFIDELLEELDFQIPRLRHHACIALWCGDNECIGATNWHGKALRETLLINYDRISREIWRRIETLDPTRLFWPSSPCSGPNNFGDGWHDDSRGDMHYWEVWHGGRDFNAFYSVKPRFCSEFGYQSFPSFETVKTFCPPEQFNVFSPVMDHHQKCNKGNAPIIGMFGKYFRMPESFESFLYLSQVQQSIAIGTGVEFWRTLKPRCMGTLFWQLNDNWPVASWASIEYGGKWKQLQCRAKRFYAPVLVTAYCDENGKEQIFAVSDVNEKLSGKVRVRTMDFAGKTVREWTLPCVLKPLESKCLKTLTDAEKNAFPADRVFLQLELEVKNAGGKVFESENTVFFAKYKSCDLQKADIKCSVSANRDGSFAISVKAAKPAFFVMLDTPGIRGNFSDNSFTVIPGETHKVTFFPKQACKLEDVRKALNSMDLRSTYN